MTYTKITVHSRFLAESCAIGDYNKDGKPDVSSGRRWYEGPDFSVEHVYREGHDDLPRDGARGRKSTPASPTISLTMRSTSTATGLTDIINISNPDAPDNKNPTPKPAPQSHATAYWYKNPGGSSQALWAAHLIHSDVRLEEHGLVDINGDGFPEIFGACKAARRRPPRATTRVTQPTPRASGRITP